jgi:hypothetical protein
VQLRDEAIAGFEHSASFKIGRCITAPARGLRDRMQKRR